MKKLLCLFVFWLCASAIWADYQAGLNAYKQGDYAMAMKLLRMAAEKDTTRAPHCQYYVGLMYENGDGTQKDYIEAAKWYSRAAAEGQIDAQLHLAYLFREGKGLPVSLAQAGFWFRKAAEMGNLRAQKELAGMCLEGIGVDRNAVEAAKWFHKVAEKGDVASQVKLGDLCAKGLGVSLNLVEAQMWYILADKKGDREAAKKRAENAKLMNPNQLFEAEKLAKEFRPK